MPRPRFVVACLAVLSATAAGLVARSQEPVFRGGVTFVNVDAYPRRDGRLVEGLRAEDFQVFEDGKPQKISAFEFIRIAPNTVDAEKRDPNTKEEGDAAAADPHSRVFVIYLDVVHTGVANGNQGVGPLLTFLNRSMGPDDVFGVMNEYAPKPVRELVFARSTSTLEAELTKYFAWGQKGQAQQPLDAFEEQAVGYCAPDISDQLIRLHREDLMATSLEELMVHLRSLRDERKNVVLVTEGWLPRGPAYGLLNSGSGDVPKIGADPGGRLGVGTPLVGQNNRSWCDQQIGSLGSIDFNDRFRNLLTSAQRANVSFYPVDLGGLRVSLSERMGPTGMRPGQTMASPPVAANSVDVLKTLAENTDGRAIVNTNDLNAGFRQIGDDLSAYYLLGYSSTNTNADGKFRKIEVKVNRPGVSVRARSGYLAPSADTRAAAEAKAASTAVPSAVADELGRLSRLRTDTEVLTYGVRSSTGLDVVAEISSQEMARGRWGSGADVRVAVSRPGGQDVVATGRIEPAFRGAIVHLPLDASDVGPWTINVRVSHGDATLEDRSEVPAAAPLAILGAPLVFRGTPSPRVPLRPVADFLFRRSERLRVEWPVLQPLTERTARVLDRKGQPLALEATVTQATPNVVDVDLALAALAEGDYLIELTAGAGGKTQRGLIAFRIVR